MPPQASKRKRDFKTSSTAKKTKKEPTSLAEGSASMSNPPMADEEPELVSDGYLSKQAKVIIILEGACLETGKLGKDHVLLNCDDHNHFLRKHNRDPTEARPDILHQVARSEPKL